MLRQIRDIVLTVFVVAMALLALQSCSEFAGQEKAKSVNQNVEPPEPPNDTVTVGGGVTGRWEGMTSVLLNCGREGPQHLLLILIEDSSDNITGVLETRFDSEEISCHIRPVIGRIDSSIITFDIDYFRFTGNLSANSMTGNIVNDTGIFVGIWSAQRVP
ncbi:hypothetical protein HY230_01225 [Candidatus Acetothermia bacterium]|nr:hypothetical protein [Candidatus Acetothermia bacterium]